MTGFESVLGAEWSSAVHSGDNVLFSFVDERTMIRSQVTHKELAGETLRLSSGMAAELGSVPAVLLLCGDPQRFLESFLACLHAGITPVVLPVDGRIVKAIPDLLARGDQGPLLLDARAEIVLAKGRGPLGGGAYLRMEELSNNGGKPGPAARRRNAGPEAFRILSRDGDSFVCHSFSWEAVLKGLTVLSEDWKLREGMKYYSWLPLDCNMGLFAGLLLPLFMKGHGFLGETDHFLGDPAHWTRVISKYRIDVSGGPDSAFSLIESNVSRKGSPPLHCWRVAWNAGEPHMNDAPLGPALAASGLSEDSVVLGYWPKESSCAFSLTRGGKSGAGGRSFAVAGDSLLVMDDHARARRGNGIEGRFFLLDDGRIANEFRDGKPTRAHSESIGPAGEKYVWSRGYGAYGPSGFRYSSSEGTRESRSGTEAVSPIPAAGDHRRNRIAIIGAAGIFPGSRDLGEFWTKLERGENLIAEVPAERWDSDALDGNPDNESFVSNVKWGGFAPGLDTFDADFFGLSPKEAQLMDPMQRKLLEVTWAAFEDAGVDISRLSGKKVGVFVGIGSFDYMQILVENRQYVHSYAATGTVQCMAANRISYMFDFKGPSEAIDTACSSSMVALHRAKRSLESGECELAVVAGANALFSPNVYVSLCNAGMLSQDGKCKAFAEGADGYVRGEGVGVIILQPEHDAGRDGHPVRAYILGSAVNHGGRTASLTAPSPLAQAEVIQEAMKAAGIGPETITYIEAHGTGTDLGDPIEIEGLKRAFLRLRPNHSWEKTCSISSAKTNIGHLEAAAGIAGVIKVVLSMEYGRIPAHLHFANPNPQIDLSGTPFQIADRTTDWARLSSSDQELPRRAGVSSFGFGGVNGHAILEEFIPSPSAKHAADGNASGTREIILISARSKDALDKYVEGYIRFLEENAFEVELKALANTSRLGRQAFDHRLAITARSNMELLELLKAFSEDKKTALAVWPELLHLGDTSETREYVDLIQSLDGIDELIIELMQGNDAGALADMWAAGHDIDWSRLPGPKERIHGLPTYPFAETRHWIPIAQKESSSKSEEKGPGEIFRIDWAASPLPEGRERGSKGEVVYIVLCDETGAADGLVAHLIASGHAFHAVYPPGKAPPRAGKKAIVQIDSASPSAWNDAVEQLIVKSSTSDASKLRLIDFRGIDKRYHEEGLSHRPEELDREIMGLFLPFVSMLVRCQKRGAKISLVALVSGLHPLGGAEVNLQYAGIWGYCRTLVLEHPDLFRAIVDIGEPSSFEPGSLLQEFEGQAEDSEVVIDEGVRYVPRLVPVPESVEPMEPSTVDGTHIITGGLGSLGLHVADWLAAKGASRVVLVGRRPVDGLANREEVRARIAAIEESGTEVVLETADVADEPAITAIIRNYTSSNELRGVYHLAGKYTNVPAKDMRIDSYSDVVSPKIRGTMNVFRALEGAERVRLVLFSSAASVWGSTTGAHYSAANHFLDRFAAFASSKGLDVKCANWAGMWKDSGMVPAEHVARFEAIGIKYTAPEEGLAIMERLLDSNDIQWVVASVNWERFLPAMNGSRTCGILQSVAKALASNSAEKNGQGHFDVSGLKGGEKLEKVASTLEERLSSILGVKPGSIDRNKGFFQMGLDSLSSIDLKKRIKGSLGVDVSTTALFDHNTIHSLARFMVDEFFADEGESPKPPSVKDEEEALGDLEGLGEDELLSMLESELS